MSFVFSQKLRLLLPCFYIASSCFISKPGQAAEPDGWQQVGAGVSQMAHGGIGLIQTPTARMTAAGELSINYTDNEEYRLWSVSIQLFPWMESTIRYTDVRTRLYSPYPGFSGNQTYKDKGIDVKFRLVQESYYLPQLSVGFRDFGGTGLFSSEFIALSKKWGAVDFHLGMGWGYLGSAGNISNPFCEINDRFCERPDGYGGRGGKVDYQNFFRGPASLFGGIEYQTPWAPLRLKLEYEGNNYTQDHAGELLQDSDVNIGAVYRWGNLDIDLNYQRGNTLGFGVHYRTDLHTAGLPKVKPAPRAVPEQRITDTEITDRNRIPQALYREAGFAVQSAHLTDDEFIIYGQQLAYRDYEEAAERIGRVLVNELPQTVKRYRIVTYSGSLPMVETVINADDFVREARYDTLYSDIRSSYVRQDPAPSTLGYYPERDTSGFYAGSELFWIQTFGNPEAFYMYQGGIFLSGGYAFNANIRIGATAKATLLENFDRFNFKVDALNTPLPRVRTYIREYVTRSRVTMENLYLHWQDRLAPDWYGQLYGGYLETMFGGIGGEVLYRQVDTSWAVGFDLNYVQQRSYENDVDFFDYKVLTGHVNVYWQPSFLADTLLTFNIGQYLAKDKGVTVDFAKRFDSGIIVGAYAAITNVSSEEYGEGSFTKGFYLSIPFDVFSLRPSTGRGRLPWIPISRDGGQALSRPVNLINVTEQRAPFYN
ncbi:YjbH domain-containing protein [Chromatiaceae bacterium AAb-1]|nr:YjbH domain-containing protein [Chromatiaceae bacterium AAb-1]